MDAAARPLWLIRAGYGLEFGSDLVIAQGLAMACTHGNTRGGYFPDMDAKLAPPSSSEAKLPLFGVLAELYKSDKIVPPRYEPDLTINQRYQKIADAKNDCLPELVRLCGRWDIDDAGDDAHFAARVAELQLFGAVAACATTRPGYEPRVDFFLYVGFTLGRAHTLTALAGCTCSRARSFCRRTWRHSRSRPPGRFSCVPTFESPSASWSSAASRPCTSPIS